MKERPILFSGPMVRALLEGRKTQTRRVVRPQPSSGVRSSVFVASGVEDGHGREIRSRYGAPGDRLWVRETFAWQLAERGGAPTVPTEFVYRATDTVDDGRWVPSIHMPRSASRLTLELKAVRIQRLQDLSEEDAQAEGPHQHPEYPEKFYHTWREAFRHLFDEVNAARGSGFTWEANPWVWALSFEVVK